MFNDTKTKLNERWAASPLYHYDSDYSFTITTRENITLCKLELINYLT